MGSRALQEGPVGNLFLSSRAPCEFCLCTASVVEEAEAVAVAEAGDRGFKNPARCSHWRDWSSFRISPKNN